MRSIRYNAGLVLAEGSYTGVCAERYESCNEPNQLSCGNSEPSLAKYGEARLIEDDGVDGVRPVVDEDMLVRIDVGDT